MKDHIFEALFFHTSDSFFIIKHKHAYLMQQDRAWCNEFKSNQYTYDLT